MSPLNLIQNENAITQHEEREKQNIPIKCFLAFFSFGISNKKSFNCCLCKTSLHLVYDTFPFDLKFKFRSFLLIITFLRNLELAIFDEIVYAQLNMLKNKI